MGDSQRRVRGYNYFPHDYKLLGSVLRGHLSLEVKRCRERSELVTLSVRGSNAPTLKFAE